MAAKEAKKSAHRTRLWIALIGLVAALATVLVKILPGGPPDGEFANAGTQSQRQGCQVIGDNATVDCAIPDDAPEPSVRVIPGPVSGTRALQISNFKPSSTVTLTLLDPMGRHCELGVAATRTVKVDGTADTAPQHYFWRWVEGEPSGTYTLVVRGFDQDGNPKTARDSFNLGPS